MKLTFIAFCIQFEGFVFWLSAHLFQLLGAETHVCLKAGQKLPFGEAETQLLHKSCILGEGVNAQDNYGPLEVHKKKKSPMRVWMVSVGLYRKLPNYPW